VYLVYLYKNTTWWWPPWCAETCICLFSYR